MEHAQVRTDTARTWACLLLQQAGSQSGRIDKPGKLGYNTSRGGEGSMVTFDKAFGRPVPCRACAWAGAFTGDGLRIRLPGLALAIAKGGPHERSG